nr:MAG TPA: hypothetical protein [Caudoviricetes sp.]
MKRKSVNSRGWICVSGIKRRRQNVHELDAIGADQFFAGRDGVRPGGLCDGLAQGIHRTHSPAVHGFKQGVLVGDGEQFPDFGLVIGSPAPVGFRNKGNGQRPGIFSRNYPAAYFMPQGSVLVGIGDNRSGSIRRGKEPFTGNIGKPACRHTPRTVRRKRIVDPVFPPFAVVPGRQIVPQVFAAFPVRGFQRFRSGYLHSIVKRGIKAAHVNFNVHARHSFSTVVFDSRMEFQPASRAACWTLTSRSSSLEVSILSHRDGTCSRANRMTVSRSSPASTEAIRDSMNPATPEVSS